MLGWLWSLVIPGPPLLDYECRYCHCSVFRDVDGVYCGTCGERYRDSEGPEYV